MQVGGRFTDHTKIAHKTERSKSGKQTGQFNIGRETMSRARMPRWRLDK